MARDHILPMLPFEKVAKQAGVARLSREGAEELRESIEEMAISIAERAVRVAMHAGRKTVTREDIEFVTGEVVPHQSAETKSEHKHAKPEHAVLEQAKEQKQEPVEQPKASA